MAAIYLLRSVYRSCSAVPCGQPDLHDTAVAHATDIMHGQRAVRLYFEIIGNSTVDR